MQIMLQVALDFLNLSQALRVAHEAVAGGADWLEAGTPLIKSEGLEAVRQLRKAFPDRTVVADLKTMDAGRLEIEAAANAGANVASILGLASDSTIHECVKAGQKYGVAVAVDLLGCPDPVGRARQVARWGAATVGIHSAIDEQMQGSDPFEQLRRVVEAVEIPVAVAGGIHSENIVQAAQAGARVIIVGGAITKSANATDATATLKRALETGEAIRTDLYRRASADNVREVLEKVSTANLCDGNHHMPGIVGLRPVWPGARVVGTALTVRTAPGDFAKPVEAIDRAEPGDVIVIDAAGCAPAVWGELASESAKNKQLAGLVVHGAVRDTADIRELGLAVWTKLVTSHAGEPQGLGEINVPIEISGQPICPGDWILADDDGVMVLPKARAVEMANRAADILEAENRIRQEIREGATTLAKVVDLLRWEKKGSGSHAG